MKRYTIPLVSLLALLAVLPGTGQSIWTPAGDALPAAAARFTLTPLGRFEAVAVGSFPIVLFYVGFGFDFAQYSGSGFQSLYAPWPFKNPKAPTPSQAELVTRLETAVALSVGVAVLDFFLRPLAMARQEAERSETVFPSPLGEKEQGQDESAATSQKPLEEGAPGPAP